MTSVGVVGHRSLEDGSAILQGVDLALKKIRQTFPEPYTLYSSLAEGADRLVAGRALLILGARLVVPLPVPLADYLSDFSPQSEVELANFLNQANEIIEMPSQAAREAAYEAAGRYILEHCDVLIALWDGHAARGQGGTGQLVAEARQRGLPLAWVLVENQNSRIAGKPGTLTLERFPEK